MSTVLSPPEARVILHNISWPLYEQLLAAHEDKSSPRFVYDRGELEITVPSYEHEELNRLIDNCVAIMAMEWNIEYCDAGSTTFKREDLERGFEPDSCFYVQHAEQIAGKKRLDLTLDPPPDLVLEVDIMLPMLEDTPDSLLSPPVSTLADAEVLHVAEAKMDATQNQRLGAVQAKGKATGLSVAERYELL